MDLSFLTAREQSEVQLARVYVAQFDHGTSEHLAYTVINKLFERLIYLEQKAAENETKDEYMD